MESVFIAMWTILLVTQVKKTDSAIDDIMYEAEEESKNSMPTPFSLSFPSDDESVNEFSDDFYNYNVDGRQEKFAKYQYDILLQKEQYDKLMEQDLPLPPNRSRRNAIKEHDKLWPNGNIPYTIDASFNATVKLIIRDAIAMWSDWTCLNFYKDMNNVHDKLHFELTTKGCGESMVGMQTGKQSINLSHRCSTNVRVVAHEIGHAIGLYHEQMRHDSDAYVTVNTNNIMNTRKARKNFEVMTKDQYKDFSKPYDYLSIMHYGKLFYSRNKTANLVTLSPKNDSYLDIIGEVQTISYLDVKIVCQLYNCSARCDSTCSGTGFMGAECQCMCRGPSDDNPIKHCQIRESCSVPPVDYSKFVVLDKNSFEPIPKTSGMFNHGTAFVIEWNDTATCGEDGSTYTCQNGTWIGALPECHPGCELKTNWKTQYTISDDFTTCAGGADNLDNCTLLDKYQHADNITLSCVSNLTHMVTSQCNNGSWTTFILNCYEVEQPDVTVIVRKTSYATIAGQTVVLECDTDDVTGRVTLVWSRPRVGLPTGFIQDNGSLTIPNVQTSYAGNYVCTGIDCQTGRVGTDIAVLNIEQISCETPPSTQNGHVEYTSGTLVGSMALYTCNDDYSLRGESERKCLPTRQWEGKSPQCVPVCETPPFIQYGNVEYPSGAFVGSRATYTCNHGYILRGNSKRKCLRTRQWRGKIPQCIPVCETLPSTQNGHVEYTSGTMVDLIATYTCDDGYSLRGERERKCLPTRQWKGNHPQCIPDKQYPNCQDILVAGLSTGDGLYNITVIDEGQRVKIEVYCDMTTDNGGWTVFQYRYDGSEEFYRVYNDYTEGFGLYPGEFWLGLKWIHALTTSGQYMLRVDLTGKDPSGDGHVTGFATYTSFSIGPAAGSYKLHVTGYLQNSTIKDNLAWHNGMAFTTKDHDVDGASSINCAVHLHGAWWYRGCGWSNLNSLYLESGVGDDTSMNWGYWPTGYRASLVASQLSFKPV